MNLLQKTERLLKQNWKERKRITLAVIVSFLINGNVGYATENESKSNIDIQAKEGSSVTVTKDKNSGGTIVNIAKPNKEGISHNEYDVFNMTGENSRVLFNNSGIDETANHNAESALGFKNVKKNQNFSDTDKASLIITEITGGDNTILEGKLEVRSNGNTGKEPYGVDLIFANENGINVNGMTYYNVDNVMYVNDRDWATKEEFNKQKKELEEEKKQKNNEDVIRAFGNSKKSEGIIHRGEKKQKDFQTDKKLGWVIPDQGISKNLEKQKLEEEKKQFEEEKRRLEEERRRKEEYQKKEQERLEKEKKDKEEAERKRLVEEQKKLEEERQKKEQERLEKEKKDKEEAERKRLAEEQKKLEEERQKKEQERLEKEKKDKEEAERKRLAEEQKKLEEEHQKKEQERLEKEKKDKEEDEKKIKELEDKIKAIEKRLEEIKEKTKEETVSKEEKNQGSKTNPIILDNEEYFSTVPSYISTSSLGSMHGNQILMKADKSGFYGVQYSNENRMNSILIDKKTGEIDIKSPDSLLAHKTSELAVTISENEKISKTDIKKEVLVIPVNYNDSKKDIKEKEADTNKVNKNIIKIGHQANESTLQTSKKSVISVEKYETTSQEILDETKKSEINVAAASTMAIGIPLQEVVEIGEQNVTVLKKLNHIEVKDPSKTQLERVDGHSKSTLVQIAEANSNGISHNEYNQFSIEQDENVLLNNNSSDSAVSSKLLSGKTFTRNKNLRGNSASLIINEVGLNNNGATRLAGGLEVLGNKSDVIIANENGVIVNGGRFENIGDLTLSTGKYKAGTSKQDFQFGERKGNIDVKENSDIKNNVNIYSKDSTINANLKAENLNIDANGNILLNNAEVSAKNIKAKGKEIVNRKGKIFSEEDIELNSSEKIINEKSALIEAKGNLSIDGKLVNTHSKIYGNSIMIDGTSVDNIKEGIIEADDIIEINSKTYLKNSDSKIKSKNAIRLKADDIYNEGNAKISAETLLIEGKKVENSAEIEASNKLGIHTTENIINKRVIAGKILDLKAEKSFKNIDSALLYAQGQLQVDANDISNIGSSILSNGSLFLKGENLITNEKGGIIQSKSDARLIGGRIINNTSSISSLAKLYLKTDELLNIGEFKSALKLTDQVRKLYKHVDVKESYWKAWYNGYNISVFIPRVKKELKVKQASIDAADDLVISKYKKDKTQVYNRDSSITANGNIYVEGSVDNLTTTSASTLENILKRIKVKLAWNSSSLVDRSQFNSGVDADGVSLFELLKEKDKLKRYQYFNLLKGLNDPELDRILNQALGEDWKVKDDIPDLKLGATIEYYSADNRAKIDSTKNIFVEGDIENSSILENVSIEQWKKEKPKIDQEARRIEDILFNMKVTMVGDSTITEENTSVEGIYSRQVSVLALLREKDPKKRKEYFEKLKGMNDPKLNEVLASTLGKDWKSKTEVPVIKEGYVGKKKKENTVYQMILEDGDERPIDDLYQLNNNDVKLRNVLQTQNGKYEKLRDNKEFLFKTSDTIKNKVEYKGYDYLLEGMKSKGKKISDAKLIGDSQYQYDMISNLWKSYDQKAPDKEYIEGRFKDSLEEAERLNLEIGKPLTEEQQKELNRNIIWYVEKEIEGEKVLTPVMYFPEDKLYTLSRIREDKAISKIGAWGSIFAESDNVTNENSTINAVKNVKIKTNVLVNRGSKEFDSDIYAGEDLDIEAKKVLSEFAALKATGDIDVTARNIDVTASDIVSKSNVKLRAENIDVKDAVLKSSTKEINSEVIGRVGHIMEEVATSTETSRASNIQGENVHLKADENLNLTGSKIKAEDESKLEGNKVNLAASMTTNTRKARSESQGTGIDDFFGGYSEARTKETKANATEVTGKNVEVNAGENLTVDGSKIKAKKNVWLESQGTLDVKNVQEEKHVATNSSSVGLLGISLGAKTLDQTKNSHSSLTAGSHLRARAARDVNVRSSDITAKDAAMISRERDVNFTADKEEIKETSTNLSLGLIGSAGAGIGGAGVTAEFDSINKMASGEVINNYVNKRQKGERIPTLASGDIGFKLAFSDREKEQINWDKSKITTEGLLNIEARKGHMELGGTDVESGSDASAIARRIDSKTYMNTSTERKTDFDFTLKQSVGASSSVVDAINTGHEIARDASNKELNTGLAAAKAVGAVTNLVFNDTVGVNSRQSMGVTLRNYTLKVEEDTQSSITAKGWLSLQATESDVNLKNVDLKGKRVILDAERDVKVSAGKRTETKDGISVSAEVRQQQTAGVSAAFGANTQLGVGGSVDFEKEHSERTEYRNSSIEGEQIYARSKRDTKIDGGTVRGEKVTKLKVGRNLEVTSKEDSYSEDRIKANAGATVSAGVGSTTIGAGNVNASAGGGRFTASGTKIGQRTSVTSGGVLDVEVEGDTLLSSATLASDVRKGQLAVRGELKVNDIETSETAGGVSVGLSGGVTGEVGLDLELGDKKDKLVQEKSVIGLRRENIKAKKITKNSKEVKVDDIETDVSYEQNIVRDVEEKGGSASLSFSVKDTKTIAKGVKNKIKNIKGKFGSSSKTGRFDNIDPIYSRLQDSSNPSDPLKRALPETPVEKNRREIEANPSSRVTAEDLKQISEGVRSQEGMVENTLYRSAGDATYSRANSGDTEGMKNNPIYEGTTTSSTYSTAGRPAEDNGYSTVRRVTGDSERIYTLKGEESSTIASRALRNSGEGNSDYETIPDTYKNGVESPYSLRGPEREHSELGVGARRNPSTDPLPAIPRQSLEAQTQGNKTSDGVYDVIKDSSTMKEGWRENGIYESTSIDMQKNPLYSEGLRRDPKRDTLPEIPASTGRKVNGAADAVYEKVAEVANSNDDPSRFKAENSDDLYTKIDPKTKKKPTQEEINKKLVKELTEKFGPKQTVHVDDEKYATVRRTDVMEEGLTPRASRDQNSGEDFERILDSASESKSRKRSVVEDGDDALTRRRESLYTTVEGIEGIQSRSNKRDSGDYEILPVKPSNMEAPTLPPRNVKGEEKVYIDELGRVVVPESQLDTISLGENTYHQQLENKLRSEAFDKLTVTDTSVSNTDYVPKKLTAQEREAFFDKIKKKAEKRDPHKETMDKIKKIAQDPNDIPKEHVLKKLEDFTYGYNNEDVLKLVTRSAEDGSKIIVPDTLDKSKIKGGRKDLGDIFFKLQFDPQYDNARKEIDNKIYETLSKNPEFKKIMNQELAGNKEEIQKLFDQVVEAKKLAFKEVIGIDIETPKLVLKDEVSKKGHSHGYYLDDVVNMNTVPPTDKGRTDKRENNKELLNTIIHELTHHDQSYLAQNKDNPELRRDLQTDARLFGINQDLYVNFDGHYKEYQGYRNQPLERDAFNAGDGLSDRLMQKVYDEPVSNAKGIGNTKYVPEKLSDMEKKALFDNVKKQAKERDTAKEAERKLKLLAENADNIPKEHMLKAVKELAYGLSIEDATALRKKAVELGKKIHRPDMIEGFEGKNIKNMGEILKKIQFDPEYVKTREEINQKIVEKLDSNKEFHDLMKQKLSGNEEGIKKLFKMVESAKHDSLKEVTGIDGKRAEVVLNTKRGPLSMKQGHYANNEVNMNAVPLLSFFRSKKQNNKEILDTIVHELTHHDQAQITRNKDRNLPEHMKQDADLMGLNETYYINSDLSNFSAYKKQPLEREAFISGHKLGEQLSKLVDKGYTGDIVENGKLREIKEIEHLPNKVNNLETPKEAKSELGDNALIYGLKYGRQELIDKVNEADPNRKNAILADSYIGKLNLGYEFEELTNFAKKLNKGEVTEDDIKEISYFNDSGAEHARKTDSRSRINAANNEDNQKIIQELLKNETAVNSLKKVGDLSEKMADIFSEMRKNEYLDLDNPKESSSFTEEQNKQIREFKALESEVNNARMDFFAEKTKLIAKETLERGGKLYFALDGLATDSTTYTKNTNINFDKLKDLFDPSNPYYDAVTSRELRYLYENYRDNPNLKFTIKNHVIENPLKTLKIEKVEDSSERR